MKMRQIVVAAALMGLMVVVLGGCGGNVSRSNFDKVEKGMTVTEVEKILGKGAVESTGTSIGSLELSGEVRVWQDKDKIIKVTFKDGRVSSKSAEGL
jgi:hypothetical protein